MAHLRGGSLLGKTAKLHTWQSDCNFSSITLSPLLYCKMAYFAFLKANAHFGNFPNLGGAPTSGHLSNFQEDIEQICLRGGRTGADGGGGLPRDPRQRVPHAPPPCTHLPSPCLWDASGLLHFIDLPPRDSSLLQRSDSQAMLSFFSPSVFCPPTM